jgi:ferredoxin
MQTKREKVQKATYSSRGKTQCINRANDKLVQDAARALQSVEAILMAVKNAVYVPTFLEERCRNCGICAASCPQSDVGRVEALFNNKWLAVGLQKTFCSYLRSMG